MRIFFVPNNFEILNTGMCEDEMYVRVRDVIICIRCGRIAENWVETVVNPLQPAFEIDVHVGRCRFLER